jgi:hypothetical protein
VITEFTLVRHLSHLSRQPLSPDQVKDWSDRFKKLGSSISTIRMVSFRTYTLLQIGLEDVYDSYRREVLPSVQKIS